MSDIPWYDHDSSDTFRLKGKNRGWLTNKAKKSGFKKEAQQALKNRGIDKYQHPSVTKEVLINQLIKFKNQVAAGDIVDQYVEDVNEYAELDEDEDEDVDVDADDEEELGEALDAKLDLSCVEEDEVEDETNTLLWGLQGVGRAGLENIARSVAGLQTLRTECQLRSVRVRENASAKTCINALIKFKNRYKRSGLPQEPVYDQTLGDDEEEEEEEDGVDDGLEVDSSSISNDSHRISDDFSLPWDLKHIRKDYLEKIAKKEGGKEFLRLACVRRQLPNVRKNAISKVCIAALVKWRKKKNKPPELDSIEDDQVDAEDIDEEEEPDASEKLELKIVTEVAKTLRTHKPCSAQRIQYVLDHFKLSLSQMMLETRFQAQREAEIRSFRARLEKANMDIADIKQRVTEIGESQKEHRKTIIKIPNKEMSTATYARHLKRLLGNDALEGQHVFHIIASENGGADHPDNYLFCLNSAFNQTIRHVYDDFNCYLAGKEKTMKAIEVSLRLGNKPRNRRKPPKKYAWKYSSVVEVESARLYAEGQKFFTAARALRRSETRGL